MYCNLQKNMKLYTLLPTIICVLGFAMYAEGRLGRVLVGDDFIGLPSYTETYGRTYQSNGHAMKSYGNRRYLTNPTRFAQIQARNARALTNSEARSMGLKNYRDEVFGYFDIDEEDEHVGAGICGYPTKYYTHPPSYYQNRDDYDRAVCKNECRHEEAVCMFHIPYCGYSNVGDREMAMRDKCHSKRASCDRRC